MSWTYEDLPKIKERKPPARSHWERNNYPVMVQPDLIMKYFFWHLRRFAPEHLTNKEGFFPK